MPAPFRTLNVRAVVEDRADGSHNVQVAYANQGLPGGPDPGMPPPVNSLKFPAGTKNITRLDGLKASDIEIHTWLAAQGCDWDSWNLREYLEHLMR